MLNFGALPMSVIFGECFRRKPAVLCGDRLTQMTKTYNDIEAVTRLLEEKERDLELAAKIGQTLLEKNKAFEERNEELDHALNQANEKLNQLKHDLTLKDELLKIYTQNYEGSDISSPDTPSSGAGHVPTLERKIKTLEDENLDLHLEASKLKLLTQDLEDKEQKLVSDCLLQLEDINKYREETNRELQEKTEECANLKDENTNYLHQIVSMQKKVRTLTAENMELQKTLEAAYDSQNYLSREIGDLKEKNEELLALLEETQEELRKFRSRERPGAMKHSFMPSLLNTTGESLASELENSMRSDVDHPKGYSSMEKRKHTWKIFETAKAAKSPGRHLSAGSCSASMLGASMSEHDDSQSVSQRSSMYFSDSESGVSEACPSDLESLYSGSSRFGRPGIPGSNDLQRALKRLSMRRANELNEMDYAKEERERQHREEMRRERCMSEMSEHSETESQITGRCRSPESTISGNSGYLSMTGSNNMYKMPEKLRIVKPLEGSVTLRQWQRLATPHLGGIFEARPGVRMKGESRLTLGTEATEEYTLSDFEEDDDLVNYPTRFQESSGVFTLTDSRVKHPSEAASDEDTDTESVSTIEDKELSSSYSSSSPRMAVGNFTSTHGTSTFSMSLGLASLLNERDIQQESTNKSQESSTTSIHSYKCSNPARISSIVSETHFNVGNVSSPSSTLTLPTNSYNLIPSPSTQSQRSEQGRDLYGLGSRSQVGIDTNAFNNDNISQNGPIKSHDAKCSETGNGDSTSALSVINKLKNTGFSLYGYLTGGVGVGGGDYNGNCDNTEVTRPSSLPLPTNNMVVTNVSASGLNYVSTVTVSASTVTSESCNMDGLATAGVPTTSSTPLKSHLASILNRKTAGGVIGALTQLRKDGAL